MDVPLDLDDLRATLRRHGVTCAYLFGSHADGTATATSDVDIAVGGDDVDDWSLRGALPDTVDLLVLDAAPELLAGRVASRGRVILDDDPPARVTWESRMRKLHADGRFRREQYRKDFAVGARAAADG